ncbi:MAG: hypothetical protein WKF34_01570 [Pyrinomonadaceae bacterium]
MKTNKFKTYSLSILFLIALTAVGSLSVLAQGRYAKTYSKSTVGGYITRLERSSNTFRRQFDQAMDRSNIDGTDDEDRYNRIVRDYENSLDELRSDFNRQRNWWDSRMNVEEMLRYARPVNDMMTSLPFGRNLETQWRAMRNDINKVADTYDLPGLAGGGWNGGGWNGGGNDGGGWNGNGQMSTPPSWAQGTFTSTNISGYTMTVDRSGRITLVGPERTSYGRWNRGTIYIDNVAYPASRNGSGMRAYDRSTGRYTEYSRNGYADGGGWNGDGNDGGGWNGSGQMSTPPSWAQGNFTSSNVGGYTMTVDRSGRITLSGPEGTSYGRWYQNSIHINNTSYPASRSGSGMRAYDRSTGRYTDYSRNGYSGGGNDGGGWNNDTGQMSTPPTWAQGTFYSENIPGYTMTINRNGQVTLYGPDQSSTGRWYQGSVYINNVVYPVSRVDNGMSARDQSTGMSTIYRRR